MSFLRILYPAKCVCCGEVLRGKSGGVCPSCQKSLPYIGEPSCARCGKPLGDDREELCADCRRHTADDTGRGLDQSAALWLYREDTRQAMLDFKYGGVSSDAVFYADELANRYRERIRRWAPDLIVPIPVHRSRERSRGYNQAGVLADALGERVGLPVREALKRVRGTVPQKSLTPSERRKNLRQAFRTRDGEELSGRRILLVDDIYTTGATMDVCAQTLKEAGAISVYGLCLCIGGGR